MDHRLKGGGGEGLDPPSLIYAWIKEIIIVITLSNNHIHIIHGLLLNDCRNKSSSKDMNVFAVSANMAYGEVNLKGAAGGGGDDAVYENPDKFIRTGSGGSTVTYEPVATHSDKPETLESASNEDTAGTNN